MDDDSGKSTNIATTTAADEHARRHQRLGDRPAITIKRDLML